MTKNSKSIIGSFGNIESPQYLPHTDFLKRMLLSDELNAPKINDINEAIDLSNAIDRNIFLNCDVDDEIANGINVMIRFWNRIDAEQEIPIKERAPIKIYINSEGGYLTSGYLIIDSIKLSKTPVYTINIGTAYSAAFEIFIAGHQRIAYKHSSFLFHEGAVGMNGDANKFRNYAEFYNNLLDMAKEHILETTKITPEDYEKHQKDDWWFTASEALKYGICDKIAEELL